MSDFQTLVTRARAVARDDRPPGDPWDDWSPAEKVAKIQAALSAGKRVVLNTYSKQFTVAEIKLVGSEAQMRSAGSKKWTSLSCEGPYAQINNLVKRAM